MNDHRAELAALRSELERLETELRFAKVRANQLESRIAREELKRDETKLTASGERPFAVPPPLPPITVQAAKAPEPTPPPLPPVIQYPAVEPAPKPEFQPAPEPVFAQRAEPETKQNFELRLGTFWFVRIGIVMLLTTMVFLGNYAYQHYVPMLGPVGKVGLLYAASFGLIAAGTILPRKQERLKNYGQVLFAGGLAAVYFTTYAAHHFSNLRIIQSAVLDGCLLLAWTSLIVWLADRKKSETLAIFAIGLAYYAALITNVGNFTLVSNLILAIAAVFFLVRNRWVTLSFLSLAASYGSYFYWRYYAGSSGLENDPARITIAGYWIIFTVAVFLTRHAEFVGRRRVSFLSFNNGAAFALLTFSFLRLQSGNFWKLSLASGVALLALSALARFLITNDELPRRAYLAQGLMLMTLGFMTKFSGPTLALVLAIESALLLVFSTQWKSRLLHNASVIIALLGVGWLISTLQSSDPRAWLKAVSLTLILLFQAVWAAKKPAELAQPEGRASALAQFPSYFAALAILNCLSAVFSLASHDQMGPILAASGLALTFSIYLLRVREISILSQGLIFVAQAQCLLHSVNAHPPLWSPLTVLTASIILSLWWRRQRILESAEEVRVPLEVVCAFAAAAIAYAWLPREIASDRWIAIAAILTVGWTIFGGLVRSWAHVAAGQIFLLGTFFVTLMHMINERAPLWYFPITLIIAFILLAAAAQRIKLRDEVRRPIQIFSQLYQWFAAILALVCVMKYVEPENRFLVLTILFAASFAAAMFRAKHTFAPGVFLAVSGIVYWLAHWENAATLQNLFAILIIAAAQFTLRKAPRLEVPQLAHQFWIMAVAGMLWIYLSRWVVVHSHGAHFYLTASWAGLAFLFFIVGLVLRERPYRMAALMVLASALGRVILLDVWKLETIYRIVSFLVLSIVLLALGYIYSRFQDKFAKWL